MSDEEGEESGHDFILVVVHAVCGKGEEEAWLRGAHISVLCHILNLQREFSLYTYRELLP